MYSATMKDGYRMGMITVIMLFGWVSGLGAQELQQDDVVWAQDSLMVAHIHQQILGSGECYEDLRVLCKEVGARLSGSPEADEAILWGGKTLQAIGAGDVRMQPVMVPHWERGGKERAWMRIDGGAKEPLRVAALGGSNNLEAGGHFPKVLAITKDLKVVQQAGEVAVQRGRAAGEFSEFDNEDYTSPMWNKLMQHPALKNSPIVVNNYNNSTVVHDSSPTRHAAPRAIDLSGNAINDDVAKYCAAIGVDPKAPLRARSPPKATKAAMNPEDENRGSYLAYGNRNVFTGAAF